MHSNFIFIFNVRFSFSFPILNFNSKSYMEPIIRFAEFEQSIFKQWMVSTAILIKVLRILWLDLCQITIRYKFELTFLSLHYFIINDYENNSFGCKERKCVRVYFCFEFKFQYWLKCIFFLSFFKFIFSSHFSHFKF